MVDPDSHKVYRASWYLGTDYREYKFRVHAFHVLWGSIPEPSAIHTRIECRLPCNPVLLRFRLFRFRSPLLTESHMIYLPGVTKMFQFTPFPANSYYTDESVMFTAGYQTSWWIPPFGNRRIISLWHFPDEYRRRMRPSSVKIS